jgi:hypothetical protein
MAPLSITVRFRSGSTITGILLLGLSARNPGLFCSPLSIFTIWTSYGRPVSSSMIEALWPLGVW